MKCDDLKKIIGDKQDVKELPADFLDAVLTPYLREKFVSVSPIVVRIKEVRERAAEIAKAKNEKEYQNDGFKLQQRFEVGQAAEVACENRLGLPYGTIYDSSVGNNVDYHHPDMIRLGYRIGCKSSQIHNAPMISPNSEYPNIVCLVNYIDGHFPVAYVAVLGVATQKLVREYGSFALLRVAEKRDKVGFYGFDYLEPLPKIELSKEISCDKAGV